MRKPRVPKSPAERLSECETHLYFLWDARRLYEKQPDRFKQIAAELRILVCETRMNSPILLDLMDEYEFRYEIQPPGASEFGPPLKPQPLPVVGWRNDPVRTKIAESLRIAIESGDEEELKKIDKQLAALAQPIEFRDWTNRGLAVYIEPYDYSHRDLVLAIAQQFGSSHEDSSVDEPIIRLQGVLIGGERGDLAPLATFADSVLNVGTMFIRHLEANHGFEPKYFGASAA